MTLNLSALAAIARQRSPIASGGRLLVDPIRIIFLPAYIERQNLTMRMSMRRFTRLTNAFSKKLENLKAAVAVHFAYYNFVRIHRTIRVSPAMAAGVDYRLWSLAVLVDLTT